jgi:cytochrome c-type protein NapB
MRPDGQRPTALPLFIFLLGSAVTATAAITVAIKRAPAEPGPAPVPAPVTVLAAPAESIAAEAQVFRTRPSMMAIEPATRREREAHPRTLKTFRYLRAYPGAPPRIPHGFTPTEFRTGACQTCHERGGYSRRFAAYVPVTPHPEMGICLQCHALDEAVTGISLPSSDPNSRCPQCHGLGGSPPPYDTVLQWRTTSWPQLSRRTANRSPPPIPHVLQGRGNCLPCHAGPGAVAEIRTTHPERADCRQCHVAFQIQAGEFTRPGDAVPGIRGAP